MTTSTPVTQALTGFARAIQPVDDALSSPVGLSVLLADLGWTIAPGADMTAVAAAFGPLPQAAVAVRTAAQALLALQANASADELRRAAGQLTAAIQQITGALRRLTQSAPASGLGFPFDQAAFWTSFAQEVLDYVVYRALDEQAPLVAGLLRFVGIISAEKIPADSVRAEHVRRTVHWDRIATAATQPQAVLASVYGWGTPSFDHVTLVANLRELLIGLGAASEVSVPSATELDRYYDPGATARTAIVGIRTPVFRAFNQASLLSLDLATLPIPPALSRIAAPDGIGVFPVLRGTTQTQFDLGNGLTATLQG